MEWQNARDLCKRVIPYFKMDIFPVEISEPLVIRYK